MAFHDLLQPLLSCTGGGIRGIGEFMSDDKVKIDSEEVSRAFRDSLFAQGELTDGAVIVEGIRAKYGFHPGRLKQQESKVREWLSALPHGFRLKEGGGWSFLNACEDEDGNQWTGLHSQMEELFCLGLGLDLVVCLMPSDLWDALPGGMPYYAVKI